MSKVIGVRLPDDVWQKLEEEARVNSELPSETTRRLLRDIFKGTPSKPDATLKQTKAKPKRQPTAKQLAWRKEFGKRMQAHKRA